jgi:hypothetical protein
MRIVRDRPYVKIADLDCGSGPRLPDCNSPLQPGTAGRVDEVYARCEVSHRAAASIQDHETSLPSAGCGLQSAFQERGRDATTISAGPAVRTASPLPSTQASALRARVSSCSGASDQLRDPSVGVRACPELVEGATRRRLAEGSEEGGVGRILRAWTSDSGCQASSRADTDGQRCSRLDRHDCSP